MARVLSASSCFLEVAFSVFFSEASYRRIAGIAWCSASLRINPFLKSIADDLPRRKSYLLICNFPPLCLGFQK